MANRDQSVTELATELGLKSATIYRYVGPHGELRGSGEKF